MWEREQECIRPFGEREKHGSFFPKGSESIPQRSFSPLGEKVRMRGLDAIQSVQELGRPIHAVFDQIGHHARLGQG
jgi:hypothetical protein